MTSTFLRVLFWFVAAVLASLPLLLIAGSNAEALTLGNESLAYRFFYSYRILHGEGGNIVLAQGFPLSAFQNLILVLSGAVNSDVQSLRSAFNDFSIVTLALNTSLLVAAFSISALTREIKWTDRILLAIVGLGPMYATAGQGFRHSMWPDYYHLNVAIAALALVLFQVAWRRPDLGRRALWVFAAGAFVGLSAANKITAGVLGIPLVLLLVFQSGPKFKLDLNRAFLAALGGLLGCALPILAFYRLNLAAVSDAFKLWLKFVKNPGGDEGFYAQLGSYLIGNHLLLFFALYVASLTILAKDLIRRPEPLRLVIFAAVTVLGGGLIFSVIKRPAGTSIFEAALFVGCLGATLFTLLPVNRINSYVTAAFGLAVLYSALFLFPWKSHIDMILVSKGHADVRWDAFRLVNEKARGRPVVFFIPDNRYQAQDLFVTLLKGMADFPTWNISARGRPTLEHFSAGLQFRNAGMPEIEPDLKHNALYIWNEAPGMPPVQQFFPELDAALKLRGANVKEIDLRTGHHFMMLEVN